MTNMSVVQAPLVMVQVSARHDEVTKVRIPTVHMLVARYFSLCAGRLPGFS